MQKTRTSLHNALIELAREKPYPSIAVKEILNRANVGRSTFYTHFRDKDELLESGILDLLRSLTDQPRSGSAVDRVLAFSRPMLEHIGQHRRTNGARMTREGRVVMHQHLQDVLTGLIADELAIVMGGGERRSMSHQIPTELVARHVASTFVLVLNWWVDSGVALTPADVDARFRSLVVPALVGLTPRLT